MINLSTDTNQTDDFVRDAILFLFNSSFGPGAVDGSDGVVESGKINRTKSEERSPS